MKNDPPQKKMTFLERLDADNEKVLGLGYNRSLAVKAALEPDEKDAEEGF